MITALIHVLFAANLVGLLVPEVMLGRAYKRAVNDGEKRALASVHLKLMTYACILVPVVVLAGIGRVMEYHYPWFDFSAMFWLAAKQMLGLLLVVWVLVTWSPIRQVARALRNEGAEGKDLPQWLRKYERAQGKSHMVTGLAWVMLILAVTKI